MLCDGWAWCIIMGDRIEERFLVEMLVATPTLEADRIEDVREALAELVARWTAKGNLATAIPGLSLVRREAPTKPASCLYEPSVVLVVQGRKRVMVGDETYEPGPHHFLLTSVDLPVLSGVIEASKEKPYLALLLKLDQRAIAEMMVDCNLPPPRGQQAGRGMILGEGTLPLFEAFHRLVTLLDEPDDIPILAPLIQREILYRLVMSDQGARLRQIASAGSPSHQTARAISWLKAHYAEPLRIEDLAARLQVSPSTFHHHFRSLTAMSPLQYQKWLRLSEARRLMLAEHLDATTAAFRVGYESPSQFSREYRRLFGTPPSRDIASLRQAPAS